MRIDGSHVSIALAGAGFLACLAASVALAFPQSRLSPLSGLAQVHEARAYALSAPSDALPGDLAQAAIETRASLRQAPANATAWLRLAYLDSRDSNGLGPDGNRALARSYAVAPLGPDDTPWRLAFALNHWTDLEQSNRVLVLDELQWAVTVGRVKARTLTTNVSDPAGRLALGLTLDLGRTNELAQSNPSGDHR